MVAIQRELLSQQLEELIQYIGDEREFIQAVHDLFGFYSDRVYHPGEAGMVIYSVRTYRVPEPLTALIARKLTSDVNLMDEQYRRLIDFIWAEQWLEMKLLAIDLARSVFKNDVEVHYEYFRTWNQERLDRAVAQHMGNAFLPSALERHSDEILSLLDDWSTGENKKSRNVLIMLKIMVQNHRFENIPGTLAIFSNIMRSVDTKILPDAISYLKTLMRRSPVETAYYLRQQSVVVRNDLFNNMVRSLVEDAVPPLRDELLEILRERKSKLDN